MVEWMSFFFFSITALLHFAFFIVEFFLFQKKEGYKLFRVKESDHQAVKIWAKNQGIYNLFLALEMILGLYFVLKLQVLVAGALIGFSALSMVGAGVTLWLTAPNLKKAALIQLGPPLVGLILIFFHVNKYF